MKNLFKTTMVLTIIMAMLTPQTTFGLEKAWFKNWRQYTSTKRVVVYHYVEKNSGKGVAAAPKDTDRHVRAVIGDPYNISVRLVSGRDRISLFEEWGQKAVFGKVESFDNAIYFAVLGHKTTLKNQDFQQIKGGWTKYKTEVFSGEIAKAADGKGYHARGKLVTGNEIYVTSRNTDGRKQDAKLMKQFLASTRVYGVNDNKTPILCKLEKVGEKKKAKPTSPATITAPKESSGVPTTDVQGGENTDMIFGDIFGDIPINAPDKISQTKTYTVVEPVSNPQLDLYGDQKMPVWDGPGIDNRPVGGSTVSGIADPSDTEALYNLFN